MLRLLLFFFLLPAGSAAARFQHGDAAAIDSDLDQGTGLYVDIISYEYPEEWLRLFAEADNGFLSNAGSLDLRNFYLHEDIKFTTGREPDQPFSMSWRSHNRLDPAFTQTERELEVSWHPGRWSLSVLSDFIQSKKYMDVGAGFGFHPGSGKNLILQYWAVDYYYNYKEEEKGSRRTRDGAFVRLAGSWSWPGWQLEWDLEENRPLTWQRPAAGLTYSHQRRSSFVQLDHQAGPDHRFRLQLRDDYKEEQNDYTAPLLHSKGMARRWTTLEFSGEYPLDYRTLRSGLRYIRRQMDNHFTAPADADTALFVEGPEEAANFRREESTLFTTMRIPLSPTQFLRPGLFISQVSLDRLESEEKVESKAALGWSLDFNRNGRVFFNLTADLDQLTVGPPWEEKSRARPWGGGNGQVMITF